MASPVHKLMQGGCVVRPRVDEEPSFGKLDSVVRRGVISLAAAMLDSGSRLAEDGLSSLMRVPSHSGFLDLKPLGQSINLRDVEDGEAAKERNHLRRPLILESLNCGGVR